MSKNNNREKEGERRAEGGGEKGWKKREKKGNWRKMEAKKKGRKVKDELPRTYLESSLSNVKRCQPMWNIKLNSLRKITLIDIFK